MRTILIDPRCDRRWRRLVERAPQASAFHMPAWITLVADHYRYPVAAPLVLGADGEALAGLPLALVASRLTGRRLVALPFSDACAPLVAAQAPTGARAALARAVTELAHERRASVEVRASFPEIGAPLVRYHRHHVELGDGAQATEGRYTAQVRRNVRKARRAGVEVRRRTDPGALHEFYALHLRTRRRLGVPTQPKSFILGLAPLLAAGQGFVSVARLDGRAVAAAVFLRAPGTLTYKYGASDRDAQAARPNNLLFADAIAWACGEGLRELDLGRSDAGQEGLRAFKRSWGAVEQPLAYTYHGSPPPALGRSAADRLLAALIRRGPAITGRVIGEVLYRHAG